MTDLSDKKYKSKISDLDVFQKANRLLKTVGEYRDFMLVRSNHLKSYWFNYLIPQVSVEEFDWNDAEEVIANEARDLVKLSYCVPDELYADYRPELEKRGLSEVATHSYMFKKMDLAYERDPSIEYEILTDADKDKYFELNQQVFGEFGDPAEYSKVFMDEVADGEQLYRTIVHKRDGQIASFGSSIMDVDDNIVFLHNSGTHINFRRQGLFGEVNKELCNMAYSQDIDEVVSILREDCPAQHGLFKLGFESKALFYIFA